MVDRRDVLRWSGVFGGIGLLGTTAGCMGSNIPGASQSSGGTFDASWLYEPGAIREVDHYGFSFRKPTVIEENEDQFDTETFERLEQTEGRYEVTGLDFDDVQAHLRFDVVDVLSASFDRQEVVDDLESGNFDDETEEGEFTIYVHDDSTRAVAVGNGTIVVGRRIAGLDVPAEDVVTEAIGAHNGDEDRYREESDALDRMLGPITGGDILSGRTQNPVSIGDQENTERISFGQTIRGELTRSDPTYPGANVRYDGYAFYAESGTGISVAMSSSDFDTLIGIEGPDGTIVASNDDGGPGLDSALDTTLTQEGVHRIIATYYSGSDGLGGYQLTLEGDGGAEPTGLLENEIARGRSLTVNGDTTEQTMSLVFEDEAQGYDVEDWATEDSRAFAEADDVQVSYDGTRAVVTGTIDTDDLTPQDV